MTCPNEPQVHAYHDGELPPAERAAAEAHIAACEPCSSLLNDLREISRRIGLAPLPEVAAVGFERLYDTWHAARERGVLRITRWLTAAAAAILVGSLLVLPSDKTNKSNDLATATPSNWEPVALMAPVVEDPATTRGEELVEVAQWMADDLAGN
jgi:anti-sigma factor RsiW